MKIKTFNDFLIDQSKKYGSKSAIVFDNFENGKRIEFSYRELEKLTAKLSFWLKNKWGLKKGDRLSFAFENTPEVIWLNFAAWRAGMVTVPL